MLAHETGHIAGGHVARLPEEMRNAFIRSIAGLLLGGAAAMGGGRNVAAMPAPACCSGSQTMAMGELYAFTRAQEQAADQAAMAYLDWLGWSAQGLATLLGRLREQEMLAAAGRTRIPAPIRCRATGWNSSPTRWPAAGRPRPWPATLDPATGWSAPSWTPSSTRR